MGWTKEQADAHNARIAAGQIKRTRPFLPTEYKKLPPEITAVSLLAEIAPSTDERKLNKTEKAYLAYLRALKPRWLGIQNITLKLADDTRYTPDFFAIDNLGVLHAREVKGFWRDDAKVKIKVAARQFPWIRFTAAVKTKTGWKHTEIKP